MKSSAPLLACPCYNNLSGHPLYPRNVFSQPVNFVTVATFDFMPDAHIAMGRLKTEGIECHLADEHLVQTDLLYSIAVGGIKLQVNEDDEQKALAILAKDYSDDIED